MACKIVFLQISFFRTIFQLNYQKNINATVNLMAVSTVHDTSRFFYFTRVNFRWDFWSVFIIYNGDTQITTVTMQFYNTTELVWWQRHDKPIIINATDHLQTVLGPGLLQKILFIAFVSQLFIPTAFASCFTPSSQKPNGVAVAILPSASDVVDSIPATEKCLCDESEAYAYFGTRMPLYVMSWYEKNKYLANISMATTYPHLL